MTINDLEAELNKSIPDAAFGDVSAACMDIYSLACSLEEITGKSRQDWEAAICNLIVEDLE